MVRGVPTCSDWSGVALSQQVSKLAPKSVIVNSSTEDGIVYSMKCMHVDIWLQLQRPINCNSGKPTGLSSGHMWLHIFTSSSASQDCGQFEWKSWGMWMCRKLHSTNIRTPGLETICWESLSSIRRQHPPPVIWGSKYYVMG